MMTIVEMKKIMAAELEGYYSSREVQSLVNGLLEWATGQDRAKLWAEAGRPLSERESEALATGIQQLKQYRPLQYITGTAWFYGLGLHVAEGVLIPRPETEELVGWILSDHQHRAGLRILDLGTGSGCIAVALSANLRNADITATDISPEALQIAERNAEKHHADIGFMLSDILDQKNSCISGEFDIIVSNPPYVRMAESRQMLPNVLDYEPHAALFVTDDDPLVFYRAIALAGKKHLRLGGDVYVEINEGLGKETCDWFSSYKYEEVILRKDIHGKDRMIRARL